LIIFLDKNGDAAMQRLYKHVETRFIASLNQMDLNGCKMRHKSHPQPLSLKREGSVSLECRLCLLYYRKETYVNKKL